MESPVYFRYGDTEVNHLKQRDKILAAAIDRIGTIRREVHPGLFSALVNSIVGQQISTKAQETIWGRIQSRMDAVTAEKIAALPVEEIQSFGITMRKAEYIRVIALKVLSGELDLDLLNSMEDDEVCCTLSGLPGVGVWTAEMLMLFSMQRPNIFSYGDLAIHRGLRMLYHHRNVSRELFEKYRRRYTPYASVASLYLWEIASGRWDYKDYAPKKLNVKK